jgi:hypothetical protein
MGKDFTKRDRGLLFVSKHLKKRRIVLYIYRIFGKNIRISFNEEKHQELLKILSLYPQAHAEADVDIKLLEKLSLPEGSFCNPKIHCSFKNGFMANFGEIKVMYMMEKNRLSIFLEELGKPDLIRHFLDMEFGTIDEKIEQIIHELMFVPMNYFFDGRALIHASAFISPEGETILIGGTGGIGKTSLELYLCKEKGFTFVSDDMCVVNEQGFVYPNLALVKIYAYNVLDDKELKKKLLKGRGLLDNLHWHLSLKLRGANKVRRKISPMKLYEKHSKNESKISKYYILVRNKETAKLKKMKIDEKMAADLTIKIIQCEYSAFHQHILWHEYNSLLGNFRPLITLEEVFLRWERVLNCAFKNTDIFVVHVPEKYDHKRFLEEFYNILNEVET